VIIIQSSMWLHCLFTVILTSVCTGWSQECLRSASQCPPRSGVDEVAWSSSWCRVELRCFPYSNASSTWPQCLLRLYCYVRVSGNGKARAGHLSQGSRGVWPRTAVAVDVAHVGDELENDYVAPRSLGMTAFLVDREGELSSAVMQRVVDRRHIVRDLKDVSDLVAPQ